MLVCFFLLAMARRWPEMVVLMMLHLVRLGLKVGIVQLLLQPVLCVGFDNGFDAQKQISVSLLEIAQALFDGWPYIFQYLSIGIV